MKLEKRLMKVAMRAARDEMKRIKQRKKANRLQRHTYELLPVIWELNSMMSMNDMMSMKEYKRKLRWLKLRRETWEPSRVDEAHEKKLKYKPTKGELAKSEVDACIRELLIATIARCGERGEIMAGPG